MATYVCWGEDGEDLSEKVKAAIERAIERGDINFGLDDDHEPVEIDVYCSKGHRNIIEA